MTVQQLTYPQVFQVLLDHRPIEIDLGYHGFSVREFLLHLIHLMELEF